MIKAVFFDIDGTLVSFQSHQVPSSAHEAIAALRKNGIKVFIATGRHLMAINNLPGLQFDGYVTLNGGLCYAGTSKELIYKHPIPQEDVAGILEYLRRKPMPCVFVREKDMYLNFCNKSVEDVFRMLNFIDVPQADLQTKADQDVFQFIAFFDELQEPDVMAALPHCRSTRWFRSFSDVVPVQSSKIVGIRKLCEHFGIAPDEVMAFGDGGNDLEMLQKAAIGIAMGNADEPVKAVADYVTSTVDEDGIARALCHFGLI